VLTNIKCAGALELFWVLGSRKKYPDFSHGKPKSAQEGTMCMTFIRRFIFDLPSGKIFTTRDCLGFGLRGAVDTALHRLVYLGIIIRLARGVFVRDEKHLRKITAREVAEEKARAFGKDVIDHGANAAKEFGLLPGNTARYLFHVNSGHSSSFKFSLGRIHLKGISQKRMRLGESRAGKSVRALDKELYQSVSLRLNHADREELRRNIRWMPAWLSARIVPIRNRWTAA
jgi:hypothetical protein